MDVDPAEIDKNRHAEIPIVGSLEHVVPKLAEALESRATAARRGRAEWLRDGAGWQAEHPFRYRRSGAAEAGVRDRAAARPDRAART